MAQRTMYVDINKGVPRVQFWARFYFVNGVMVNDIKPVDAKNNLLVKFADDMATSAPVKSVLDSASAEADGIENWSETNQIGP